MVGDLQGVEWFYSSGFEVNSFAHALLPLRRCLATLLCLFLICLLTMGSRGTTNSLQTAPVLLPVTSGEGFGFKRVFVGWSKCLTSLIASFSSVSSTGRADDRGSFARNGCVDHADHASCSRSRAEIFESCLDYISAGFVRSERHYYNTALFGRRSRCFAVAHRFCIKLVGRGDIPDIPYKVGQANHLLCHPSCPRFCFHPCHLLLLAPRTFALRRAG